MPHRVTLRKEAIQPVLIAKGPDCEGPDLGLLILSPADADSLSAKKSFYNLSAHREAALDHPPALNEGIWLLCGFAGELTSEYSPHRGYAKVMKFCGLYVAGWVGNEYCIGDFDYFDFEVWYGSADTPRSFGGFSGAGLWQARLTRTPDGALRTERPVLSGVAFYQTDCHTNLVETLRVVRCHARRSVYVHVPEAVRKCHMRKT